MDTCLLIVVPTVPHFFFTSPQCKLANDANVMYIFLCLCTNKIQLQVRSLLVLHLVMLVSLGLSKCQFYKKSWLPGPTYQTRTETWQQSKPFKPALFFRLSALQKTLIAGLSLGLFTLACRECIRDVALQIEGALNHNMSRTTTWQKCPQRWHTFFIVTSSVKNITCLLVLSTRAIFGAHYYLLTDENKMRISEWLQ